jgi:hypothetical protein
LDVTLEGWICLTVEVEAPAVEFILLFVVSESMSVAHADQLNALKHFGWSQPAMSEPFVAISAKGIQFSCLIEHKSGVLAAVYSRGSVLLIEDVNLYQRTYFLERLTFKLLIRYLEFLPTGLSFVEDGAQFSRGADSSAKD